MKNAPIRRWLFLLFVVSITHFGANAQPATDSAACQSRMDRAIDYVNKHFDFDLYLGGSSSLTRNSTLSNSKNRPGLRNLYFQWDISMPLGRHKPFLAFGVQNLTMPIRHPFVLPTGNPAFGPEADARLTLSTAFTGLGYSYRLSGNASGAGRTQGKGDGWFIGVAAYLHFLNLSNNPYLSNTYYSAQIGNTLVSTSDGLQAKTVYPAFEVRLAYNYRARPFVVRGLMLGLRSSPTPLFFNPQFRSYVPLTLIAAIVY